MMRLRVSTLEAYRRVLQTEYGDEAELAADIRAGQDTPAKNWMMSAGTLWHAALEHHATAGVPDDTPHLISGNLTFAADAVRSALALRGPGLCEVTARRRIDTPFGRVELKGTCDHILGRVVRDAKAKWSTPDPRDYEVSIQWRAYLWLFDADRFTYDLFAFRDPDAVGYCELRETVSFSLWRYPGMEREVLEWVDSFLRWAADRYLLDCLEGALPAPAAG